MREFYKGSYDQVVEITGLRSYVKESHPHTRIIVCKLAVDGLQAPKDKVLKVNLYAQKINSSLPITNLQ
jgi:hypothetical protein